MKNATYYVRGTVSLDALNDIVDGESAKIYTRDDRLILLVEFSPDLSSEDVAALRAMLEDRAWNRDVTLEKTEG